MSSSFRQEITRKIMTEGSFVNGRWSDSVASSETIYASVQPLTVQETQQLPEGRRDSQSYWLFTVTELSTVDSKNPDRVTIGSDDYEVYKIYPWQNGVLSHYKVLVQKVLET